MGQKLTYKSKILPWLGVALALLMQPLFMLHLQAHLRSDLTPSLFALPGARQALSVPTFPDQGHDCPVCRLFQGLNRIVLPVPALLFVLSSILILAYLLLPCPHGADSRSYHLRGPPVIA